jgi:serine/tyrosine/threonine adenylyltransferase
MAVKIEQRFAKALKADNSKTNHPRQVSDAHFCYVKPEEFQNGNLILFNDDLAKSLDISVGEIEEYTQIFLGQKVLDHSFAMCYGGHQFGNWAGQLGDGRAINLGNVIDADGIPQELQLKGAGPTPFSRTADGYAVLRSSIREFLCSEAMYHLGIPTTRALALLGTGESVLRDIMYNGNPAYEPGAIVCRVSKSFIRFGQFEIFASRQDWESLNQLLAYSIEQYHPDLISDPNRYVVFFQRVSDATCDMILDWMRVGFVHGVMNTDNMSILGETIDYGPYGWMDNFDPSFTPNTTDLPGRRYCYANQPQIAQWNLLKLANAIAPLVPDHIEDLQNTLHSFANRYQNGYLEMMKGKLGLATSNDIDLDLINKLEKVLFETNVDMTIFYRNLSFVTDSSQFSRLITPACYDGTVHQDLKDWLDLFIQRINLESIDMSARKAKMDAINPKYVLRNYMAQQAIEAAYKGDYGPTLELYQLLQKPYDEQIDREEYFRLRPDWAINKVGCSMLSCSS